MKPIHERPGAQLLTDYKRHESGIDLFRAYLERREADRPRNESWQKNLYEKLAEGMPSGEADSAFDTNIFLNILDALDPIVRDIVKFCDSVGPTDDQLVNIRSALRIGKGKAPHDADLQRKKWIVVAHWIDAYNKMEAGSPHQSETQLKKDIATLAGVSQTTALNHWKEFKLKNPQQERWAKHISDRGKIASGAKQYINQQRATVSVSGPVRRAPFQFGKGVQTKPR